MRRDFIQHLNRLAGNYKVSSISTTWNDIDKIEDEFTDVEGFTVVIKKDMLEYKKDFFGKECIKAIPKKILKAQPELTVEEYNAQRILDEMEIS